MYSYSRMISNLDRNTYLLKEILAAKQRLLYNSSNTIMYAESDIIVIYNNIESYFCGLISYNDRFLMITCMFMTDYKNYTVTGSWDNWQTDYPLILLPECGWIILFDNITILLGKHHYKLKHNGSWIEPDENTLREKDNSGNWNNVLFIHE